MFGTVRHGAVIDRREQAGMLALTEAATISGIRWYDVAELVELAGSVSAVAEGSATFYEDREIALATALREAVTEDLIGGPRLSSACSVGATHGW